MINRRIFRLRAEGGFSLVELMVAMTAGLILIAALTLLYGASSRTDRSLKKAGEMVENARFALFSFADDVRHAGFYGTFHGALPGIAGLPPPCGASVGDALLGAALPVQAYSGGGLSVEAKACFTSIGLSDKDYTADSDVIIVRRARTTAVATAGDLLPGALYLQSNASQLDVQVAGSVADFDVTTDDATGGASKYLNKLGQPAELRRLEVRIYFVSPCSNEKCGSGDDGIPTLKRLELDSTGAVPIYRVVPVAMGVERMNVDFGVDSIPNTLDPVTQAYGDGMVDSFKKASDLAVADWLQVVAAKIYLVVRDIDRTTGHVDNKTYDVGASSPAGYAPGGAYRRHGFQSEVLIVNHSGKREI